MRTSTSTEGSKCWKIGSPCSKSNSKTSGTTSQSDVQVVQVEQSEDGNLRVFCDVKKYYIKATSEFSMGFKSSCNSGTYRSRFDECARGFWGWNKMHALNAIGKKEEAIIVIAVTLFVVFHFLIQYFRFWFASTLTFVNFIFQHRCYFKLLKYNQISLKWVHLLWVLKQTKR